MLPSKSVRGISIALIVLGGVLLLTEIVGLTMFRTVCDWTCGITFGGWKGFLVILSGILGIVLGSPKIATADQHKKGFARFLIGTITTGLIAVVAIIESNLRIPAYAERYEEDIYLHGSLMGFSIGFRVFISILLLVIIAIDVFGAYFSLINLGVGCGAHRLNTGPEQVISVLESSSESPLAFPAQLVRKVMHATSSAQAERPVVGPSISTISGSDGNRRKASSVFSRKRNGSEVFAHPDVSVVIDSKITTDDYEAAESEQFDVEDDKQPLAPTHSARNVKKF